MSRFRTDRRRRVGFDRGDRAPRTGGWTANASASTAFAVGCFPVRSATAHDRSPRPAGSATTRSPSALAHLSRPGQPAGAHATAVSGGHASSTRASRVCARVEIRRQPGDAAEGRIAALVPTLGPYGLDRPVPTSVCAQEGKYPVHGHDGSHNPWFAPGTGRPLAAVRAIAVPLKEGPLAIAQPDRGPGSRPEPWGAVPEP